MRKKNTIQKMSKQSYSEQANLINKKTVVFRDNLLLLNNKLI